MKRNEGALRPRMAAALLLVLFREIWGWDHNPKQLNNQQRGQHRRLGNAHGAREDPEAASFRRARNAPWAALAGCIMPPNLLGHTMSGLHTRQAAVAGVESSQDPFHELWELPSSVCAVPHRRGASCKYGGKTIATIVATTQSNKLNFEPV